MVLLMVGHGSSLASLGAHLRASSSVPLCLHLVSDVSAHREAEQWGMRAHTLSRMPADAQKLHRGFANVTHGPGGIYMWKPLLHYLLPLDKAIVLDSDVALIHDLAGLWRQFLRFGNETVAGLALEQAPFYLQWYPEGGFNGGVQLLNFRAMRQPGGEFERELRRFASGERGDIGYL